MDDDNKETSDVELIREKEQQLKRITLMYESALKEMETKIKIISDEFRMLYNYNPIEHIESRIKTPESIIRKCRKKMQEKLRILFFGLSGLDNNWLTVEEFEKLVVRIKDIEKYESSSNDNGK